MDKEAWRAAVHGVSKSRTWLSKGTELNNHFLLWEFYTKTHLLLNYNYVLGTGLGAF